MQTTLNINNNKIYNLTNDTNNDGVVNKGYVDSADQNLSNKIDNNIKNVNTKIANVVINISQTEDKIKQYVDESHISSSNFKDEFRYLMESVDDSSPESDISVVGIIYLERSPHMFNKKVYSLLLGRSLQNKYAGRIGFNLYQIPEGEHTICIEFIPVTMNKVSVGVLSTS